MQEIKNVGVHFLAKSSIDVDEIQYVATFVETHAKFMCTNNVQGRELCWHDFMEYV